MSGRGLLIVQCQAIARLSAAIDCQSPGEITESVGSVADVDRIIAALGVDRGRDARGCRRHVDGVALAGAIDRQACQPRVADRSA